MAWFYLAPTAIGGSTTYVVTSGISMEPSFHTGDLAIVRPASQYRVGDIVAYHSTLLHVITLHRIVAIHNGRYTFKGDNNNFTDPTHPSRAALVGRLWLRVPHGGMLLHWLHTPLIGALLAGGAGLLL
ncbi:MAG: signal peptidase I, partial [Solirubrobacteraceae bacterium]